MRVCYQVFQRCLRWCIFLSSDHWGISWYWIQEQQGVIRLDGEDYWIETLRTSYPFGQNERKKKPDPNLPVECSFPPIPRSRQRSSRCRNNLNFDNPNMESIFNCIPNYIADDIKNTYTRTI